MKPFTKISAGIFTVMALTHAARLFYGWEAHIGNVTVPVWVSGVFIVVAALLARGLWKESR